MSITPEQIKSFKVGHRVRVDTEYDGYRLTGSATVITVEDKALYVAMGVDAVPSSYERLWITVPMRDCSLC